MVSAAEIKEAYAAVENSTPEFLPIDVSNFTGPLVKGLDEDTLRKMPAEALAFLDAKYKLATGKFKDPAEGYRLLLSQLSALAAKSGDRRLRAFAKILKKTAKRRLGEKDAAKLIALHEELGGGISDSLIPADAKKALHAQYASFVRDYATKPTRGSKLASAFLSRQPAARVAIANITVKEAVAAFFACMAGPFILIVLFATLFKALGETEETASAASLMVGIVSWLFSLLWLKSIRE